MAKKGAQLQAQQLFTTQPELTREQIAETVGVDIKTLRKWITAGNWEDERTLRTVTREELYKSAMAQLAAVNADIAANDKPGVPTKQQNDSISILTKAIEALSDTDKVKVFSVFGDFLTWLTKTHPKDVKRFGELSMQYSNTLKN